MIHVCTYSYVLLIADKINSGHSKLVLSDICIIYALTTCDNEHNWG